MLDDILLHKIRAMMYKHSYLWYCLLFMLFTVQFLSGRRGSGSQVEVEKKMRNKNLWRQKNVTKISENEENISAPEDGFKRFHGSSCAKGNRGCQVATFRPFLASPVVNLWFWLSQAKSAYFGRFRWCTCQSRFDTIQIWSEVSTVTSAHLWARFSRLPYQPLQLWAE